MKINAIKHFVISLLVLACVSLQAQESQADVEKFRHEFIEKNFTFESANFRVHYEEGLEKHAREIATICEDLYDLYKNKYGITLPQKTEVLVADDAISNGWALAFQNTIGIWVHDFNWHYRGSPDWLENVVAHEYAHIVSMSLSHKMPSWIPYLQIGYFTHSNTKKRTEALYIYPSEVLPPWFFEGIAQYESTMQGGDSWDAHRDMIIRQLTLNDQLLTWDEMSVFNGRFDSYEKTYNHGFSLVKYIAETYGEETIVAMLNECSRFGRLVFDRTIERVLGITGRELYDEWKAHLKTHYLAQLESLGDTTAGQIISEKGYSNYWPKFSNDEKKIYYLSNNGRDNGRMHLLSYNMIDTVPDSVAFRVETPIVNGFYSLHPDSNRVLYTSLGIPEAFIENFRWRERVWDIYSYPLSPDSVEPKFKKKLISRHTEMENLSAAIYSPDGTKIAAVRRNKDQNILVLSGDMGKTWKRLYPDFRNDTLAIHSIYSFDWSPDGSKIALGYLDRNNRKVGVYNLVDQSFTVIDDDGKDARDPRFSADSKKLYFASDRKHGIFNIYRFNYTNGMIEQMTNCVGGAFAPDISDAEDRILYTTYTADGFTIFMADSVKVLSSKEAKLEIRKGYAPKKDLVGGIPSKYNAMPRKLFVIPSLISEEVLTVPGDPFEGVRHTKYGALVLLNDPLYFRESRGNSLLFFFLTESYLKQLGDMRDDLLSSTKRYATDIGVMGVSEVFPFDIKMSYFLRNIPSTNSFVHNSYGYDIVETTNYALQPSMFDLQLSYPVGPLNFNYYFSLFNYKLQIDIGEGNKLYLNYDPSKNIRNGLVVSHTKTAPTVAMNISPHRFVVKGQYEYNNAKYIDPDEALIVEDGRIKENYDHFNYHIVKGAVKKARPSFLNPNVDMEWGAHGSYLLESDKNDKNLKFPQLYVPSIQVPGYAHFYSTEPTIHEIRPNPDDKDFVDTVETPNDTVPAAGKALFGAHLSYRFPLYPGIIDKKIGFIYLDKLYGAVNGGGVVTANSGSSLMKKSFGDWMMFAGLEMRLSTIAFNSYPLALKFRWDHGFERTMKGINLGQPIGENRFTFMIGFEFDNWTIVEEPDGLADRYRPAHMR